MNQHNNFSKLQIDWISKKLEKAEKSGFTNDTQAEILAKSKSLRKGL